MPRVTRSREIAATTASIWDLVADPYNLPRWWPRVQRVEGVEGEGTGMQWTAVLGTAEGRGVRADFKCGQLEEEERMGWEQLLAGSPFERHLRRYALEVELRDSAKGTEVVLSASQTLRGLSRLGSPMMRGAQGKLLEEALDGLERALT
jgi:carbon monoxide dehydrogenase subunit G